MNEYKGILSLLIFCIELVLLVNVLIFSKSKFKSNVVTLLALLSAYQFFEFLICGLNLMSGFVVYLAFVSITFLPPSGFALAMKVNRKSKSRLNTLIYIPAVFFTLYYILTIQKFRVMECNLFYAIYYYPLGFLYGLFYYIPIIASLYLFIKELLQNTNPQIKKQNLILLIGFLSFLVPTIIAILIYPHWREFIESMMCKFAVVLALFISYFALKFKN